MDKWQNMHDKLRKVGEQTVALLPGLEAIIYREYPTPDIYMMLERKTKFLWIFNTYEQVARIYQTWASDDQFILDLLPCADKELQRNIRSAFRKVQKANPKQLFKISGD